MVAQVGQDLVRTLVRNGVMRSFLTGSPVARGRSTELLQNTVSRKNHCKPRCGVKGKEDFLEPTGLGKPHLRAITPILQTARRGGKLTGQGVSPLVPTRAQSSRVYAVGRWMQAKHSLQEAQAEGGVRQRRHNSEDWKQNAGQDNSRPRTCELVALFVNEPPVFAILTEFAQGDPTISFRQIEPCLADSNEDAG